MVIIHRQEELMHYGVPGTHWGIRRYQNKDGSYKPGAEGRYYKPVKGSPVGRSGMASKVGRISSSGSGGGGGSATKNDTDKKETGKSGGMNAKTRDGRDYHIYDASEKLPVGKETKKKSGGGGKGSAKKAEKGSGGGGSSGGGSQEKHAKSEKAEEAEFKISHLYDRISDLFGSKSLTDEDWDEVNLSDKDIAEIDDLIKKYRQYKSANASETKRTKKIDVFIEQYERWKKKKKPKNNVADKQTDSKIDTRSMPKDYITDPKSEPNKRKKESISHSDNCSEYIGILGIHYWIRRNQEGY